MARGDLNQLLAEIVRLQAAQGPLPSYQQSTAVAGAALAPYAEPRITEPLPKKDVRGPALVSRILDIASRPLYSVAEPFREAVVEAKEAGASNIAEFATAAPRAPGDVLGDIWEGFSGKAKTTGADIAEAAGEPPGVPRSIAGFALDVGLDPLTYVGVGLGRRLGQQALKSTDALRSVEEGSEAAARSITEDISRRATQEAQLQRQPFTLEPGAAPPLPQAPVRQGNVAPIRPQEPPRVFMAEGRPQPNLSLPAIGPGPDITRPAITAEPSTQFTKGLQAGPFGRPIPVTATKPLTPRDIAQIRVGVQKGLSIEDAAPGYRPLTDYEKQVLQRGIAEGKNAKQLRLELQGRTDTPLTEQILQDIEIPATPREMPTVATAERGEAIATPVARSESMQNLIDEVSGAGINWRRMAQRQMQSLPEDADRLTVIRALETQRDLQRSPVFKNMINQQIRKLREGVTPASLLESAHVKPPEFPKLNLSAGRRNQAINIADNFIRTNTYDEVNHVGQTNLFNRIQSWVNNKRNKIPDKAKPQVMYHMLRVAEDRLLENGRKLVDAEGLSVRLSDVVNLAGGPRVLSTRFVDDFRKAKPLQAVENVKSVNEPIIAQQILDPVMKTARQSAEQMSPWMPPSRTVQIGNDLSRELENIAKQAGASSREGNTAKRFMEDFFNPGRDQLYSDVMQEARGLVRQTMSGKVDPHVLHRINNKVYDALSGNPKYLGRQIPQNRVVEAIMTRFATWWNAKDLRPFAREYIDTARNVAAAFERSMTPIIRSTTKSQREAAWRVAQGKTSAGSPEEAELSQRFQFLMEKLLGSHGITDSRAVAESVLTRSGTTMKDINKELPKRLQFIDTRGATATGRRYDYSDGQWMHSWKEWDAAEPSETLYQVTRAMQLATRKNAMLDDAAARWGLPTKGGEFQHQVRIERLQGFYFPKEIADQLSTVWNRLETDKFKQGPKVIQLADKIQRMWKTGVTIYSPSHHIRNLNGDIFLSALDGVTTTTPYRKSLQVLHAHKSKYPENLENVFNIMDPDLRDAAMRAQPGKVIVTTKTGHTMTAEQTYQAAESQGFLLRAATLEDLLGGESTFSTFGSGFRPFGGRVHQTAAKASELRDHYVRMAHFIDALSKSRAKTLRDAVEEAGRRVKKFHPDGSDLTGFEQSFLRRAIPFYSWLRKSTPLIIEGMVMRPHVSLLFPKAMSNLQEITGIESEGPANPFPMDQMFPDWIKEKGIGPTIPPPPHGLSGIGRQQTWRGDAPGYVIVNPSNPMTDQIAQFSDPRTAILSSVSPLARIPAELVTDQTSLGIPLSEVEGGTAGHLAQQIPALGIGARVTGMTRPDEPYHPEQLTNWLLTGGFITGTGPYRSQAQFEIREKLAELGKKEREARK